MQSNNVESLPRLNLKELLTVLLKHYGIHEGVYDLAIGLKVAVGPIGPESEPLPGAAFGVADVGIIRTDKRGGFIVDAAEVNPAPRAPRASGKKKPAKT